MRQNSYKNLLGDDVSGIAGRTQNIPLYVLFDDVKNLLCQHFLVGNDFAFAERIFQGSFIVFITVATYSQNWQPHKRTILMVPVKGRMLGYSLKIILACL